MRKTKTQTLVLSALLMAMHIILSYFSLDLPLMKVNLSPLPIILAGFLFGPTVGLTVGLIGSLLYQMLKFGIDPTTILWILPVGIRGLLLGVYAKVKRYKLKALGMSVAIILTSLIATLLNTIGLYIAGYINMAEKSLWAVIGPRLLNSLLVSIVCIVIVLPVIKPLRKFLHIYGSGEKDMNLLAYKEKSKCKIAAVVVTVFLLYAYYIDGGSILQGFENMKNIWLYVGLRDMIPAILAVLMSVLIFVKKVSPKAVLGILTGFFFTEILGQFLLLSSEKVYVGFILEAENLLKLGMNILAIVFTVMVILKGLKASGGAFCIALAKGILTFFSIGSLSSFLITALVVILAVVILSSVEDYEELPMKKIKGEKINFARRNVGSCIILTIMTGGIFGIIWLVKICKDLGRLHGDENPVGSEVLMYLLVPFYSVYWGYDKGKQMFEDSQKRGGNLTNRKYVYLFMNLMFMQLFTLGFIQTQLNMYQNR